MMAMEEEKKTLAWERYEAGRAYNNSLVPNQYSLVNANVEFFAGNQWVGLPQTAAMSRLPKPIFNIIKRIAQLFVATLTSTRTTINFEPLTNYGDSAAAGTSDDPQASTDPDNNLAAYATDEVRNILEKFHMDYRVREALFDGAQTGDYCAHFFWDPHRRPYGGAFGNVRGEIRMELVDGINVMFGNPAEDDVEEQPYIILVGRAPVASLRWEYKQRHPEAEHVADLIQPDSDYGDQAGVGGKTELNITDRSAGKCLYVYMYERKTKVKKLTNPDGTPVMEPKLDESGRPIPAKDDKGKPIINPDGTPVYEMVQAVEYVPTIHVTKATKSVAIYEDVDTGLDRYPIAWGNWEKQKNQYHGRALVTGIIPNQIFINSMFAMVMRHLQLQGFPKTVYNADLIGQWTNEIGTAIGVRGLQPGQSISQMVQTISPANMSESIIRTIDQVITYTKECLGATDVQMGNVKPDNTSALMVLQTSSEVPLENTRSGMYEWLENIGAILLDMMGTYYGKRYMIRDRTYQEPVVDPSTGQYKINEITGQMETKQVTRRVQELFDFSQFKHLWLNVRSDVGATTYFSEIAMVQTLDNLRTAGVLDTINYLERLPDRLMPRKAELIEQLKVQAGLQAEAMQAQNEQAAAGAAAGAASAAQMMVNGEMPMKATRSGPKQTAPTGEMDRDKLVSTMPVNTQKNFDALTGKSQRALTRVQELRT